MNSDIKPSGRDLLNAALKAFEARDRDHAAALLAKLDADSPPLGDSWGAVSRLADTLGEYTLGLSAMRRYVAASPHDVNRRLEYADFLARNGRIKDRRSLKLPPPIAARSPPPQGEGLGPPRRPQKERSPGRPLSCE